MSTNETKGNRRPQQWDRCFNPNLTLLQGMLLNFGWSVQEKSPHSPYLLVTPESLTRESTRAGASETAAPQGRGQTEAGDKNQLGVEEKSEQQPPLGQRSFYKGKQHAVITSWSISREPQASTAHLTHPHLWGCSYFQANSDPRKRGH